MFPGLHLETVAMAWNVTRHHGTQSEDAGVSLAVQLNQRYLPAALQSCQHVASGHAQMISNEKRGVLWCRLLFHRIHRCSQCLESIYFMLVGGFNPSEKYESDGIIIPTIWDIPTIGENNSHVATINQLWILIHFTSTFSWENYNISLT